MEGFSTSSSAALEAGDGLMRAELRLGLMLARELLLALLLKADAELTEDPPKDGLDCGSGELAGVAIKVGVTSLLVTMATVVVLLLPRDLMLGRGRALSSKLGRMTGVNVLLGLVKVSRLRDDGLASEALIDDSDAGLMLEASVKSLSSSSKLSELEARLGVMEADANSRPTVEDKSASPDSKSGTSVGAMLAARLKACVEVGTISLLS